MSAKYENREGENRPKGRGRAAAREDPFLAKGFESITASKSQGVRRRFAAVRPSSRIEASRDFL